MSHVDGGTKDLDSSESFGLGVGFALTPELAQKVRHVLLAGSAWLLASHQ